MMRSDEGRKGRASLVRDILRMRRIGTKIDDRCNYSDSREKKYNTEKYLAASEGDMAALRSVKVGKGGGGSVSIFRRR